MHSTVSNNKRRSRKMLADQLQYATNYVQLGEYVEQKNRWQAIFKAPEITFPLSQATANHLMEGIASALSPENLACDGELSASQVRAKARELDAVKGQLEQYCLNNWLDTPVCSY